MNSEYNCPNCQKPLHLALINTGTLLWCGNGKCKSDACNQGATARSEAEAFKELEANWDKEAE
jgi:ssDNA-binding Zn-finger/Zn-ribbon topoisomerase 1